VGDRIRQPNRSAPVLSDERDVVQSEVVNECAKVVGVILWPVTPVNGLVREPEADVVRGDTVVVVAQPCDETAIEKRPCRIAMQHQDRAAGTFVDVVHPVRRQVKVPRLKRIFPHIYPGHDAASPCCAST
jgi:hypothetical protein